MARSVQELLDILALEPLEDNLFRGRSSQVGWQRIFGGLVIAQALMAAARTVEGRVAHSMHAYFLLPGDPKVPIVYSIDRIRDGRSFNTRRVVAIQHGQAIFSLAASFHAEEQGLDHQTPMPIVPFPEELEARDAAIAAAASPLGEKVKAYFARARPIELRPVEMERYLSPEPRNPSFNMWMRAFEPMPDDPAIHQCALAYASDMTLLDTSLVAHGRTLFEPSLQAASLDHSIWFHRTFRMDEWLLYAQDSPSSSGGRGFARGSVFRRDGTLAASVAQEGLIRQRRPNPPA